MESQKTENKIHLGAYGFCLDPEGRLLLARVSDGFADAGAWTLPGGGVDWGEHPDQAVRREIEEETGLKELKIQSIVSIYSHTYLNSSEISLPPLHHVGIIYLVDADTYELRNEIAGTTNLCQWLGESQARSLPLTPLGEYSVNLAWPAEPA
jgi:ADP-ribose pyrophosphatase YjhB (NUDIX family)